MSDIEKWMNMYSSTAIKLQECTKNMTYEEIHNSMSELNSLVAEMKEIDKLRADIEKLLNFCKSNKEEVTPMHLYIIDYNIEQYSQRNAALKNNVKSFYNKIGFESDLI